MSSAGSSSKTETEGGLDERPEAKRVSQRFTLADDDSVDVESMLRGSISLPRLEQEFGLADSAASSCSDFTKLEDADGSGGSDHEQRDVGESSAI